MEGTCGGSLYWFGLPLQSSEAGIAEAFGVLVLTLHRANYAWAFVSVGPRLNRSDERNVADLGSAHCHCVSALTRGAEWR